jgi:hypothetical protein
MLGLKKFLTFVADKGKGFFTNLFTKRKDTASHLTDLCEQLISEDGVVSGITIAREIWQLYEKSTLEEKEKFFLEIDKNLNLIIQSLIELVEILLITATR